MRYRSLYSEWDRPSSAAKGNGGPDLKKNLLMVCSALLLLYLLPLILLMCMVGAITTNNRIFDAWVLYCVGIIGFVLLARGLNVAPMVLGFILGRIVESNFRTGVISGRGSVMGFFSRPVAMCLVAFGIFMAVWTNRGGFKKKKNAKAD